MSETEVVRKAMNCAKALGNTHVILVCQRASALTRSLAHAHAQARLLFWCGRTFSPIHTNATSKTLPLVVIRTPFF